MLISKLCIIILIGGFMATYNNKYNINRNAAKISQWDEIYCTLLNKILTEGVETINRTGINTISIPNEQFILNNVLEEFPILETKKVIIQNALTELLWFYQAQSNDVRWLQERSNPIWNEWMIDEDGIYRIYESTTDNYEPNKEIDVYDLDGNKLNLKAKSKIIGKNIKSAKYYGINYAYTIGTAYGWIVNRYKKVDEIISKLKTNPSDRRMVLSLWQDEFLKTAVLPSCVWSHTLKVSNDTLHMAVNQRSCDTPIGLPFNVSQYAILLYMYAKEAGLKPGSLSWNISDCHVYVNQIDGIKTQLERYNNLKRLSTFVQNNPDNRIVNLYKKLESDYYISKDETLKNEMDLIKHLLTRENPELILNDKKSFYEYENIPILDKEYKKNNPTGNPDIMVRKYTHLPYIKMPIAQ